MDCPVCTANAEQIATAIDGMGIICPTCGEYDVSSSVLAAEDWQRLDPDDRCDVLGDAKRSGQPGARPTITNDLLTAYMERREKPTDNGSASLLSCRVADADSPETISPRWPRRTSPHPSVRLAPRLLRLKYPVPLLRAGPDAETRPQSPD